MATVVKTTVVQPAMITMAAMNTALKTPAITRSTLWKASPMVR
jgi:hypothetical protein